MGPAPGGNWQSQFSAPDFVRRYLQVARRAERGRLVAGFAGSSAARWKQAVARPRAPASAAVLLLVTQRAPKAIPPGLHSAPAIKADQSCLEVKCPERK